MKKHYLSNMKKITMLFIFALQLLNVSTTNAQSSFPSPETHLEARIAPVVSSNSLTQNVRDHLVGYLSNPSQIETTQSKIVVNKTNTNALANLNRDKDGNKNNTKTTNRAAVLALANNCAASCGTFPANPPRTVINP